MTTELLNHLRALASAKHRLPKGFTCDTNEELGPYISHEDYVWYFADDTTDTPTEIMDFLGRLMRAIEGEGKPRFNREDFYGEGRWIVKNGEGLYEIWPFPYGNAESEAEALLRCILAATKVVANV